MNLHVPNLPGQGGHIRRRRETDRAKREIRDDRVSTCKRCGWGIFAGQPRTWSHQPIGLVHHPACPDHATEGSTR